MTAAEARRPVGFILAVSAIMAGLYALDRFLAKLETTELQREAAWEYRQGVEALNRRDTRQAVEYLSRAHTLVRGNRDYQLLLVDALANDGRRAEAIANVRELLGFSPNDGAANLRMARLMAADARVSDAAAYYHRAIYGSWPKDPERQRLDARIELAEYLARQNRGRELLAEVLVLHDEAQNTPKLARRVAQLYALAGSPGRAAEAYRELLQASPDDVDAYAGLGQAEIDQGNYRLAQIAFLNAVRRDPKNQALAQRLQLANNLAQTDPAARRLSVADKFRRTQALLERVRAIEGECGGQTPAATPVASSRVKPSEDAAEQNLADAQRIWAGLSPACRAGHQGEVTGRLMEKLTAP